MKCPKCGYIGFEAADRCRNCGYDFSLAVPGRADANLPLRTDEVAGPMGDFELGGGPRPPRQAPGPKGRRRNDAPPGDAPPDLPLFLQDPGADAPLVTPAAATPPLAVRRATPPPSKPRPRATPRPSEPTPELALLPAEPDTLAGAGPDSASGPEAVAGLGRRFLAALLDVVLLLAVDLAVVYFTIRVCRLTPTEVRILPVGPLAGFLALLDGGYLAALTAVSGQTVGKMALGLRVVSRDDQPVRAGQAVLRAVLLVGSALPAGLGLAPALFDRDRRGVHDHLAGTRVVLR